MKFQTIIITQPWQNHIANCLSKSIKVTIWLNLIKCGNLNKFLVFLFNFKCEKQKCNAEKMQFPKQEQQQKKFHCLSSSFKRFLECNTYFKNLATIKETTYVNLSSSCTYVCKKRKTIPPKNLDFPAQFWISRPLTFPLSGSSRCYFGYYILSF